MEGANITHKEIVFQNCKLHLLPIVKTRHPKTESSGKHTDKEVAAILKKMRPKNFFQLEHPKAIFINHLNEPQDMFLENLFYRYHSLIIGIEIDDDFHHRAEFGQYYWDVKELLREQAYFYDFSKVSKEGVTEEKDESDSDKSDQDESDQEDSDKEESDQEDSDKEEGDQDQEEEDEFEENEGDYIICNILLRLGYKRSQHLTPKQLAQMIFSFFSFLKKQKKGKTRYQKLREIANGYPLVIFINYPDATQSKHIEIHNRMIREKNYVISKKPRIECRIFKYKYKKALKIAHQRV